MTNEDMYLYSLKAITGKVEEMRAAQNKYKNLAAVYKQTGSIPDMDAANRAYIAAMLHEKSVDAMVIEVGALMRNAPAAPPIGADTGIDWFIVYLISAFAVIVFMALWTMIDLTVALYFLGVTAVLVLIAAACFILFCHRQSKTVQEYNL